MNVFDNLWGRRIDPSVRKMLAVIYILYLLALLEHIFLPSYGILMLPAFGFLIGSHAINRSSYTDHAYFLILCMFIWVIFLWSDHFFYIHKIKFNFHTYMIGWMLDFILILYGFTHFITQKPLFHKRKINALRLFYRRL